MLGEAQRARRQLVTAEPFKVTRFKASPEPPLRVGTLVDTSGSMAWAEQTLPSVAWAISRGVQQIKDSKAAAVLIGSGVTSLHAPGDVPAKVRPYRGGGNHENFGAGFDALNGALQLTGPRGARVLVVLSDGIYTSAQARRAQEACSVLKHSGGLVLWVGPPESRVPDGAEFVEVPVTEGGGHPHSLIGVHVAAERALRIRDAMSAAITDAVCELLRSIKQ